jgi:uncharacterized glyoxalase superfamily protein PhnB
MATQFGGCILYVEDVLGTVSFYERAFGLERKFVAETKLYAEMKGSSTLGFADRAFVKGNIPTELLKSDRGTAPIAAEVVIVADDVDHTYRRAIEGGAVEVAPPVDKPWKQRVAYVRDPNGFLVEVCSQWSP